MSRPRPGFREDRRPGFGNGCGSHEEATYLVRAGKKCWCWRPGSALTEFVGHYLEDERLQTALLGQGVIGTNAGPFDPGTASIHFHHSSGRMFGQAGAWGYEEGGIGSVSFLLHDIAQANARDANDCF